jgi:hypothetical protein
MFTGVNIMEIKVVLPPGPGLYSGQTLLISNVHIIAQLGSPFEDIINNQIDCYKAVLENPGTEINPNALLCQEIYVVEKAIWDEYYRIQEERMKAYGYNPEFKLKEEIGLVGTTFPHKAQYGSCT